MEMKHFAPSGASHDGHILVEFPNGEVALATRQKYEP